MPIKEASFIQEYAIHHFVMGSLFLGIAAVDYFTFFNYPMQRSIILARTERSRSENHKLIELTQTTSEDMLF